MPGNWHVRFGGRPHGKGPANLRAPRRAAYPTGYLPRDRSGAECPFPALAVVGPHPVV